jgi:hypothetical protein
MVEVEKREVGGKPRLAVKVVGLVFAVCVIMALPSALGSTVQPDKKSVLTPPYSGTASYQDTRDIGLCGKTSANAKITKPVFFDFTTGAGGLSTRSSGSTCRNGASSWGSTDQNTRVYIPIAFHKGHPTIYVNGTYAVTGNMALISGHCVLLSSPNPAFCDRDVSADAFVDAYFLDMTSANPRYYGVGSVYFYNDTYFDSYCNSGTCSNSTSGANGTLGTYSLSGSFSFIYTISKKMVSTDAYALELYADGESGGECYAQGFLVLGCSFSTTMNFGTGGNGFVVSSIVVR